MAETSPDVRTQQHLEVTAKRLRMRGDGSVIHLGMVVSFAIVAALPFILDRFVASEGLALGALVATLLLVAFVVHRVTQPAVLKRRPQRFRSNARSVKIPPAGRASIPRPGRRHQPFATRTRDACRKAS